MKTYSELRKTQDCTGDIKARNLREIARISFMRLPALFHNPQEPVSLLSGAEQKDLAAFQQKMGSRNTGNQVLAAKLSDTMLTRRLANMRRCSVHPGAQAWDRDQRETGRAIIESVDLDGIGGFDQIDAGSTTLTYAAE